MANIDPNNESRFDELWRLTVSDGKHTHPPGLFPQRHGTTSRITPHHKAKIKELRNSQVKAILIMDRLRKDDPTIQTSMKHVYNELAKVKSKEMEGMTVIQFMMHNFRQDADTYKWTLNCLRELLNGVEPDGILTDRELGLLKALSNVFPVSYLMSSIFHINRNIEVKATKFMGGNKDQGLIFQRGVLAKLLKSEIEEEYHYNYNEIVGRYAGYPKLIQHLNDTWLIYKEKFVRAYTHNVYHFGNTCTNRVESSHSSAKGWLNASTGGVDNVQSKLQDQVYIQFSQLKCDFSLSSKLRKHIAAWSCFQVLICYITHMALEKFDQEMESLTMQDPSTCTPYLWNIHGLPCACKILHKMEDNDRFVISDLHPFWSTMAVEPSELSEYHVNREAIVDRQINDLNCHLNVVASLRGIVYSSTTHLSEPSLVNTKGRPKNNSTKRGPSRWQYHIDEKTIRSYCGSKGSQFSPATKIPKAKIDRSTDGTPQSNMKDYVNVMADGNCGYRCIAQPMYGDQEKWPRVRGEFLIELYEHVDLYTAMFGSTGYVQVIHKCDCPSGPCPQAY
ncbi:PREDICTED: uncharacterized protein LOC105964597 [Erythranthe guttata]|uniref:uncharacterized protein LOC105964597 n=1 Tax=Erythranthe guttata TaxID=4155 RepID=UPI00064DCA14|nr:PREDICTED: uncharacterized protein LOC105964597 [Erythranthe guttata]|eukprot:XP_012844560.1 PREDICTED: uncharacterized protein LOC105964597 [Erythranthe guttata]